MSDIGIPITSSDFLLSHNRVVLDYTNRDFAAIRAQLVGLAKGLMPDWETAGEAGDFGTLLLELFAYMGDVLHFYIDRTASEAFLSTAQRRQSVLYIADMLGYTPIGQQAASVAIQFAMDSQAGNAQYPNDSVAAANYSVTIPAKTRISTADTGSGNVFIFETDSAVVLTPGSTVNTTATEGVTISNRQVGTSSGYPNWMIELDTGVIFNSISVYSREGGQIVDWTQLTNLASALPTQSAFSTFVDDQNKTFIMFGDNASGRIPPINTNVYVTYRTGKGAAANTLSTGVINSITPSNGTNIYGITVQNTEQPVGGTDVETVESMRYNVPRSAGRLKNRAITLTDYADLALQVPGVSKATAYGTLYSAVYVRVAPVGGNATDAYMNSICTGVEHFLADKILVGTTVIAEPRTFDELWTNVHVRVNVHVDASFNRTKVRKDVETALTSMFSFDNMDFGERVTIGQVYRTALSVTGVEWAELTWLDTSQPSDAGVEISIYSNDDMRKINNISTSDIKILRLDPSSVVESPFYFPDLDESERTHNGLWVRAVGGLPNT